jgi:uncharacterized protein
MAATVLCHIIVVTALDNIGVREHYLVQLCRARQSFCSQNRPDPGGAMWTKWVLVLFLVSSLALVHRMALAGPLHDAAQAGDVEKVRELLTQGVDVDERDARGETPLIKAALAGQTAAAAALIEAGADVGARNDRGFSGLHAAAYSGSVEIATMLLDHGVPVDDRAGRAITPLHVAGEENQVAVAELLLNHGADRDALQASGYTPLTAATYMRGTNVMALLKRRGAECAPPDVLGAAAHAECMAAGN